MQKLAEWLQEETGYQPSVHFCCFNQDNRAAIVAGAKGRFTLDQAMTGRELSEILSIDYDVLRTKRQFEQGLNLDYFLRELVGISELGVTFEENNEHSQT